MKTENNKELKDLTTMGVAAKARCFLEYDSVADLQAALRWIQNNGENYTRPILHIGGGSNLLFLDNYDGCVLHSAITGMDLLKEDEQSVTLRAGGGIVWDHLVAEFLERGYYGLENLSGIPGEVGASAVQNIGAYGTEAKDFIVRVETVDLRTGNVRIFEANECQYAYRHSLFKTPEQRGRYAVTHVHYRLSKVFTPQLSYTALREAWENSATREGAQDIRRLVIGMRNTKLPDPRVLGNCGSFFMNPIVTQDKFETLRQDYPTIPSFPAAGNNVKIPAAWLIQQCGWKGRREGNCGVYERQALVLVNHGEATGTEVAALSDRIQHDVKERFGIDIHPEANFI